MNKNIQLAFMILVILRVSLSAQIKSDKSLCQSHDDPEIHTIIVKGEKNLYDFADYLNIKDDQTNMDPGISPEGDYMLRSAFTKDGQKILVCNGRTDNISVFDWQSMSVLTTVDVGNYPCDVAVTDDYAVVTCIFGNEVYVIDLTDYSIAGVFTTNEQPAVVEVSQDGNYAYIGCDINDVCEVINLTTLTHTLSIQNFPESLSSFAFVTGNGRSYFLLH